MGQFDFTFSPELKRLFSQKLARIDEIAPKMLDEAAPIAEQKIQSAIPLLKSEERKTPAALQELLNSHVKALKTVKCKNGGWIKPISFKGKKADGTRMMAIAAYFEYGTSQTSDGKGWLRSAISDSSQACEDKMIEVFNREVFGD